jgi:hypothetical protein
MDNGGVFAESRRCTHFLPIKMVGNYIVILKWSFSSVEMMARDHPAHIKYCSGTVS